jgi:hypothetical protein
MTQLTLNTIVGVSLPCQAFVCDIYGNQCQSIGLIFTTPTTITLPPQFNMAPAIGLRLQDFTGCEKFKVLVCIDDPLVEKQFQDLEDFFFMDYEIYKFQ